MRCLRIQIVAGLCFLATLLPSSPVWSQPTECPLSTALGELRGWLQTSPEGPAWASYLQLNLIEQELAKGPAADRATMTGALAQFGSGAPGLQMPRFVKVRNGLVNWLALQPAPSADQLPAMIRAAKAIFLPRTACDLQMARENLAATIKQLNVQLAAIDKTKAEDWRKFLTLDAVEQQLAQPGAMDLPTLDAAHAKFNSGYDGLGLVWFLDVRDTLRQYLTTARAIGDTQLRTKYAAVLDLLAKRLGTYMANPNPDDASYVTIYLDWLHEAGQADWIASAIRKSLSHSNVYVQVSAGMIASRVNNPVSESSPVDDYILGTEIHGTGTTTGQVTARLTPCEEQATIDLMFDGVTASSSIGHNGPVQICTTGNTHIQGLKRLLVVRDTVTSLPTTSSAGTATSINDIQDFKDRQLVERIAWKRADKQKGEAEAIASQHATWRFNARMDEQADTMLKRMNDSVNKKFHKPLADHRLLPEEIRTRTTADYLEAIVKTSPNGYLGAPTVPPEKIEGSRDFAVQCHESAINNLTGAALSGIILEDKRFQETVTTYFGLPERIQTEGDKEEWAITFAKQQPITAAFKDGGFSITVRGAGYRNADRDYPGMNVTVNYKIHNTPRGLAAIRQGKLKIVPPGFSPDQGRQLSAREQVLRNMLERRFDRVFDLEILPKNVVLKDDNGDGKTDSKATKREPMELKLVRWDTKAGWMVMQWERVAPKANADTPKSASGKTAPPAKPVSATATASAK